MSTLEKAGQDVKAYTVVLGAQWGDEGKGKLVDILSKDFDLIVRATGGANAGHTVYFNENGVTKKFVFHLLPSGILYPQVQCLIGNGVVLHVPSLFEEIEALKKEGFEVEQKIRISDRVHLLFEYHKCIDGAQEDAKGSAKVGTTRRGIGPAYADKINRRGLRLCDLKNWEKFVEKYKANYEWHKTNYGFDYDFEKELQELQLLRDRLLAFLVSDVLMLNQAFEQGKKILVEGANATLLDIDHGTYPFVTSSNPSIGGVFTGTGLSPRHLGENIGVVKAYMTRVGSGPFPTELLDALGDSIREAGGEYGSTTGRPRRCGWFDAVATRYSVLLNGFTCLNLTKLDVLDDLDEIKVAVGYQDAEGRPSNSVPGSLEEYANYTPVYETLPGWKQSLKEVSTWDALPVNAKKYVERLEELVGCHFKYIGVGQRRDQLLIRE
jgi:adenylosuccinate synthase